MIRTFIAVDLPEAFVDTVADVQQEFRGINIKLVDPKQVHITMKFLGDVPEKSIPDIGDALSGIECESFAAKVHGVGAFPKPSYARVVYVGASPEDAFNRLYTEVERVLKPLGFKREKRAFTPHATLARVKNISKDQRIKLADIISRQSAIEVGTMTVDILKLKKSTLAPKGAIYETLKEVCL
ncbi:MAG TPA: RNA 2',3'-cyclic phosphodiesterase [Methanosarcinales archaeon]|nr:RNA 2',3'-cyclic phosphodiesterase [Methanosarcinales archaeon]